MGDRWAIQAVVATRSLLADRRNRSSASAVSSNQASFGAASWGGGHGCNLVGAVHAEIGPLGKYWRSSPLVFSLVPRCHGL